VWNFLDVNKKEIEATQTTYIITMRFRDLKTNINEGVNKFFKILVANSKFQALET
jgi:hypothetical protein